MALGENEVEDGGGLLTCCRSTWGIRRILGWDLGGRFGGGLPEKLGCRGWLPGCLR